MVAETALRQLEAVREEQVLLYHTIPQNFRFEAGKTYKVEFDYEAGSSAYAVVLGDGERFNNATDNDYLAVTAGTGKASHHEFTVTGSESGQTWFGIYANGANSREELTDSKTSFLIT